MRGRVIGVRFVTHKKYIRSIENDTRHFGPYT